MCPVYETDVRVCTEIKELPPPPEFPTAARISEFMAQLDELMRRTNPSFPHAHMGPSFILQKVTQVKGLIHLRWPVQPHPSNHQRQVGMNTTPPGDKDGTP